LCTSLASAFYLITYRKETQALPLNLGLVMLTFLLVTGLVYTETIDAPTEEDENDESSTKTMIGFLIFMIFFCIGIIYPFFASKAGMKQGSSDIITSQVLNALRTQGYSSLKLNQ